MEILHYKLVEAGPDATVVAHSLGAVLWMQYASRADRMSVGRVLLVAPPGARELDDLGRVQGHRTMSLHKERVNLAATHLRIAGSLDDPYCRRSFDEEYTRPLALNPIYLPDRFQHLNIASGHGPWPFALRWSLVGTSFVSTQKLNQPGWEELSGKP
jgi:uncharacterized protein